MSELGDLLLEALSAVLVVLEEVKGGAGGREKHHIALQRVETLHEDKGLLHPRRIEGGDRQGVKGGVQLGAVGGEVDQRLALRLHEWLDLLVVVALVGTAEEEDRPPVRHRLEGVAGGIDIGSLGVIDVLHSVEDARQLHAVLYAGEVLQRPGDSAVLEVGIQPQGVEHEAGGHDVAGVVGALELQAGVVDEALLATRETDVDRVALEVGGGVGASEGEGEVVRRAWIPAGEHGGCLGIIGEGDGVVLLGLVLEYPTLGIGVELQLVVVPIEVVGRDIHQHCGVQVGVVHVVELEAGELHDVDLVRVADEALGEGETDIATRHRIYATRLQEVSGEGGGGGLAIGPRDAYEDATLGNVLCGKLNL